MAGNAPLQAATAAILRGSRSERIVRLVALRRRLELMNLEKRGDARLWRSAWRARERWTSRWADRAEASLLAAQDRVDVEAVAHLAQREWVGKHRLLRKEAARAPVDAVRERIDAYVDPSQRHRQEVAGYVALALDASADAGQYTLDALGLNRTFAWANPRTMGRDLFAVRGSKVVQGMYGAHRDRLASIVVRATDPSAPLAIGDVVRQVREEWPGVARWQAERIARSETAAVWETTNYNAMRLNGVPGAEVITATGPSIGITSEPVCPVCVEIAASGPWHEGEGWEVPPYHPSCRCTLVPIMEYADGSHWLPPDEPWAGQDMAICGSDESFLMAKVRDRLERMGAVLKSAAACAVPLPELVPTPKVMTDEAVMRAAVQSFSERLGKPGLDDADVQELGGMAQAMLSGIKNPTSERVFALTEPGGSVRGALSMDVSSSVMFDVKALGSDISGGRLALVRAAAREAVREKRDTLRITVLERNVDELTRAGFKVTDPSTGYAAKLEISGEHLSRFSTSRLGSSVPKAPIEGRGVKGQMSSGTGELKPASADTDPLVKQMQDMMAGRPGVEHLAASDAKEMIEEALTARLTGAAGWDPGAVKAAFHYGTSSDVNERKVVRELVSNWAITSSDTDARALALQIAVKEEFGLPVKAFAAGDIGGAATVKEAEELLSRQGVRESLRLFVRAMYDETQANLKALDVKELAVYRGVRVPSHQLDKWGGAGVRKQEIADNPMASWSTNYDVARGFSNDSAVLRGSVPSELVLSTPKTGFGCLTENEVVVLNNGKSEAWSLIASETKVTPALRETLKLEAKTLESRMQEIQRPVEIAAASIPMTPAGIKLLDEYKTVYKRLEAVHLALRSGSIRTQIPIKEADYIRAIEDALPKPPSRPAPVRRAKYDDVGDTMNDPAVLNVLPDPSLKIASTPSAARARMERTARIRASSIINISARLENADWTKSTSDFATEIPSTVEAVREMLRERRTTVQDFKRLPAYTLAVKAHPWLREL